MSGTATTADLRAVTGCIFDIQRFSIHDGPGIRTNVFLKGCPLRCAWCHNPEGLKPHGELSYVPDRCIGCGYCARACPNGAHQMIGGKHAFFRERCRRCGACAKGCYAKALEWVGRDATVGEVLDEVLRDRAFYETSGGGLTLSGGEPLLQLDFADALLRAAREAGLHNVVETCGFAEWADLDRLRPAVDLWLYDYKHTDPNAHRRFTGVSNERILENLRRLDAAGAAIVLRCPIVPGGNDDDAHFEGIRRLAGELVNLKGVEIMPYHRLGEGKLLRFGISDLKRYVATDPPADVVESWRRRLGEFTTTA
jgi:pyruvate formate lyase activating enzyme